MVREMLLSDLKRTMTSMDFISLQQRNCDLRELEQGTEGMVVKEARCTAEG